VRILYSARELNRTIAVRCIRSVWVSCVRPRHRLFFLSGGTWKGLSNGLCAGAFGRTLSATSASESALRVTPPTAPTGFENKGCNVLRSTHGSVRSAKWSGTPVLCRLECDVMLEWHYGKAGRLAGTVWNEGLSVGEKCAVSVN
jgi:hypothetical protein